MQSYLVVAMGITASAMSLERRSYSGVATFNDYAAQGKYASDTPLLFLKMFRALMCQSSTVCGPKQGVSGTYGVAIGDLSPNIWSGDKCSGSIDFSEW